MSQFNSSLSQQRWEACHSIMGVEIPAYAVVEVVSADLASEMGGITDEPVLLVQRCSIANVGSGFVPPMPIDSYATRGHRIRFNGPVAIPAGGFGYVTRDTPAPALCHSPLGAPTVVDDLLYVPVAGQWYLQELYGLAGTSEVTDFIGVYQMAFVAPITTEQSDCVVGLVTLASRSLVDMTL